MKRIQNIIKHNLLLKLVSLAIGFVIWALAYNVSNPEVTETVTCAVEVINEDELTSIDKTYSLDISVVRISYKVRSQDRRKVSSNDFSAYVNLEDYSVTGAVPVYYTVSSGATRYINSVTISPIVAHVEVVDMVAKSFEVETTVTGTVADGMAAAGIELSQTEVTLYGPVSDIGRIARAAAEVSIEGAEDTVSGVLEPVYYDSSDNIIVLDPETKVQNEISYEVPVYRTKKLSVSTSYTGVPAAGYSLNSFTVEPSYVTVYGPDEILDQYTALTIPESVINLAGTTTNVAVLVDATAYLPDGLYISGEADISIVASIGRSSMPAVTPMPRTTAAATEAATEASTEAAADGNDEGTGDGTGDENADEEGGSYGDTAGSDGTVQEGDSVSGTGDGSSSSQGESASTAVTGDSVSGPGGEGSDASDETVITIIGVDGDVSDDGGSESVVSYSSGE